MSGDRNSGCRSSAALGGSSGGRSSSGGKGGSGGKHPKGSGMKKPGWEDAGVEFYREAYPGALENLYDNSLRTLLPSKRYSIGTLGRATVRRRASMRTARRRRQSSATTTLVHTTRRGSDTYLEVMPDLTQGVDEEETWEELQQIRLHAVSMQEKRHLKRQLLSAPTLRTRGFAAVQLSRRKLTSSVKSRIKEMISKIGICHGSLRYIEGNFGTGLVAFFTFIKWLLFLNFFSSLLIIGFILVPQILYSQPEVYCGINQTESFAYERMVPISSSLSPAFSSLVPKNILVNPTDPTKPNFKQTTMGSKPTTATKSRAPDLSLPPTKPFIPKPKLSIPVPKSKDSKSSHKSRDPYIQVFDPPNNAFVPLDEDFEFSGTQFNPTTEVYDTLPTNSFLPPTNYVPPPESPSDHDYIPSISTDYNSDSYDGNYQPDFDISTYNTDVLDIREEELDFSPSPVSSSQQPTVDIFFSEDYFETNDSRSPSYAALYGPDNDNSSNYECCFHEYKKHVRNKESNNKLPVLIQLLVDSVQGTGKIEISYLFYGFYPRLNFTIPEMYNFPYRLSLAYLSVMVFIFVISLVLMVRKAARGLRDSLRSSEGQFYQFSNLVFGGWDHCIENNKAATIKKKAIYNEFKNFIETERYKDEKEQRTRKEKCRLYFKRLLINLLVVIILGASFFAIYHATSFSWKMSNSHRHINFYIFGESDEKNTEVSKDDIPWWQTLIFEFLPSGTIVTLNIVVPQIFKFLVQMERYTPNFILTLTLIRTIVLRLASLVILLFTVYIPIRNCEEDAQEGQCVGKGEVCSEQIRCWETYVGQQLYKLTLLDLIIMVLNTFVINLPRKIIGHKILRGSRIGQAIGSIEFEIPKHVLDIVYGQTLCWLGMFYAPLLPAITCIKLVLVYYIKYFDCAVNTTQSSQLYRTSRSNSLFISILLISYIATIIPVGFSIAELKPSVSCGPFYNLPSIWSEFVNLIKASPQWLQNFLFFLATAGFAVPAIILLILGLYYYYAVAAANKHMVSLLKHQLVLEGHDKQFLLTRLDKMIKRTQELEEMQRSEMSSDFNGGEYSTSVNNDLTLDIRGGS